MKKLNVAVLFGGRSFEHEVSLTSAKNIINALDREKYNVTLLGIDKRGKWHYESEENYLSGGLSPKDIALTPSNIEAFLTPALNSKNLLILRGQEIERQHIDVVIPVLHGPFGEDGTVQGLFELSGVAYVGSEVTGSAIGMDKDIMKRLLRDAGIPGPKFTTISHSDYKKSTLQPEAILSATGLPCFVKPVRLGSSVGISKVKKENDLFRAIEEALQYDLKVIIEEAIEGREIECAVLGNDTPRASLPGEIVSNHEFYSYEAKYIDEKGADLHIPAKLTAKQTQEVQELSITVFKILSARGLARIDFFLTKKEKFLCNEINTFPGFTDISMYPRLWEATGISYSELLDKLIELALERKKLKERLRVSS